jgi:exosome complex exonuclease DIS3/RRP44
MTSLKRSSQSDPFASNISSKVFVRSTRSGKVQKIVREVYLRRDIPCSSPLCKECSQNIPTDAAGKGTPSVAIFKGEAMMARKLIR